eukprot:1258981-Amphidinium_carterae.1
MGSEEYFASSCCKEKRPSKARWPWLKGPRFPRALDLKLRINNILDTSEANCTGTFIPVIEEHVLLVREQVPGLWEVPQRSKWDVVGAPEQHDCSCMGILEFISVLPHITYKICNTKGGVSRWGVLGDGLRALKVALVI